MNPAKKSQRLKKLRLHKETLKHVLGGTHSEFSHLCNTVPTEMGEPWCDDTTDNCTKPPD